MKRAIIYAANSKLIRRMIFADGAADEAALYDGSHVQPGEEIHVVDDEVEIRHHYDAHQHICALHDVDHREAFSGRCAVVRDGVVVGVVCADPELDTHPHGDLLPHDTAVIGDVIGA